MTYGEVDPRKPSSNAWKSTCYRVSCAATNAEQLISAEPVTLEDGPLYTLLIALGIGTATGTVWGLVINPGAYIVGPLLGGIAFVASFALMSRRLLKQIQPKLVEAQKLAQSNQIRKAIETLEKRQTFLEKKIQKLDDNFMLLVYFDKCISNNSL